MGGGLVKEMAWKLNMGNWVETHLEKPAGRGSQAHAGKGLGNSCPHLASMSVSSLKILEIGVHGCVTG